MYRTKTIIPSPIPPSDITTLSTIPWCRHILSHPTHFIPIPTPCREPKASTEDTFIAETLCTPSTFDIWQTFFYIGGSVPPPGQNERSLEKGGDGGKKGKDEKEGLLAIISTGSGLNGHPHILHGGAISVILDEVLGRLAHYYCEEELDGLAGGGLFTAYLNTVFKKPIKTPGVMLCRAWIVDEGETISKIEKDEKRISRDKESIVAQEKTKPKRRKMKVEGTIEDGLGNIQATGEALMILVNGVRL